MKKTWKVAMYWGLFILFILVGEGIVCYEVYDKIKIKDSLKKENSLFLLFYIFNYIIKKVR